MAEFFFKLKFAGLVLLQLVLSLFGVSVSYQVSVRRTDSNQVAALEQVDMGQAIALLFMVAVVLAFVLGGVGMVLASRCGP